MSDTSYTVFQHYGTNAQRIAFTPVPPATGNPIYIWYETDTDKTFAYTTTWHQISAASSGSAISALTGDVTATGPGSVAATIANDAVTLAKLANAAANDKVLGSGNAGAGANYAEITLGSGLAMTGTTLSASGSGGTVTNTGTLTSGKTIIGNGSADVTVSSLTGTVVGSSSGTLAAATAGTDYTNLAFKTIAVSGQSDVVADTAADTLTLAAGTNVTITTNAGTDTITIAASGGGGSGTVTNTGTLTSGKTIIGNGTVDVTVSSLTANLVASSSGTLAGAVASANDKLLGSGNSGSAAAYAEITLGTGLTMTGTTLSASGGSGGGGQVLLGVYTGSGANDIQVVTRNASGQSGAIFQSDYDEYEVHITELTISTNNIELRWQFSSNGGSSWDSTSAYYSWWAGLSNTTAAFTGANNGGTYWLLAANLNSTAARSYQAVITVQNPLSTALGKMGIGNIGYTNQGAVGSAAWGGYFDVSGTAYNAFKVFPGTVTVSGNIKVYGLAK